MLAHVFSSFLFGICTVLARGQPRRCSCPGDLEALAGQWPGVCVAEWDTGVLTDAISRRCLPAASSSRGHYITQKLIKQQQEAFNGSPVRVSGREGHCSAFPPFRCALPSRGTCPGCLLVSKAQTGPVGGDLSPVTAPLGAAVYFSHFHAERGFP